MYFMVSNLQNVSHLKYVHKWLYEFSGLAAKVLPNIILFDKPLRTMKFLFIKPTPYLVYSRSDNVATTYGYICITVMQNASVYAQ